MASTKSSETSVPDRGQPATDSVYDFLYHDGRRIASLLAQFDPSGHLTQLERGKRAQRSSEETSAVDLLGGIPGVLKADSRNGSSVGKLHEEEVLRVYDPTWSNARALLDLLDERELIAREIGAAHVGQIVLVTGSLTVLDLKVVQKMWPMKQVQTLVRTGVGNGAGDPKGLETRAGRTKARGDKLGAAGLTDVIIEMMQFLPHAIHGTIEGDAATWFTLDAEGLITDPVHIALKHGHKVPGNWAALGILDARPDDFSIATQEMLPVGKTDDLVAGIAKAMTPIVRGFLGRPAAAYGITPLLLFREVG